MSSIPGYNHCRNVSDRVCNWETRYRRECTNGPSRRVCRNEASREVCRTNSRGERRCRTVPGRQVCEDKPGRQTCSQVPYRDRVCHNESRRVCSWEPSRRQCDQVPYQEYQCRDVVRYRSIPYACKKPVEVPYQAEKEFKHKVNVKFLDKDKIGDAQLTIKFNDDNTLNIEAQNANENSIITHRVKPVVRDREYEFESNLDIMFYSKEKVMAPLTSTTSGMWLNKLGEFSVVVDKSFFETASVIKIEVFTKEGERHFKKVLRNKDFKAEAISADKVKLSIDFRKHKYERLYNAFGHIKLKVDFGIKVSLTGKILGPELKLDRVHTHQVKSYRHR